MRTQLMAATLLGALALAGCNAPAGIAYNPNPPPPPVRAEIIPLPPVSEQVSIWQPGHWDWAGNGYVWREGRWVQREGHGTTWQDGYWSNVSGPWTWVSAHWL